MIIKGLLGNLSLEFISSLGSSVSGFPVKGLGLGLRFCLVFRFSVHRMVLGILRL